MAATRKHGKQDKTNQYKNETRQYYNKTITMQGKTIKKNNTIQDNTRQ